MEATSRAEALADLKARKLERELKRADALDRAWRTFKTQILLDAVCASGAGIMTLADKLDPTTGAFWSAAGILFGKSLAASAFSYVYRLVKEPKSTQTA